MEKLITLENVTKEYDGKPIIDHVFHEFSAGESIAFTGHNGCGKSTMLKILAGLIRINSGKVGYHNIIRFSYVPEKFPGMDIKMSDYLNNIAKIEGKDSSEVKGLIRDFFLESMTDTRLNELSKGSLQKVGVIQALISPHDAILLDEPLSGQDAASQDVFIRKINELRNRGITVFMSCHEKKLIEELSDHEYIISNGKLYCRDKDRESFFKVSVRKVPGVTPRPDMKDHGNKYVILVSSDELKEKILKLYNEGWELCGLEEYH